MYVASTSILECNERYLLLVCSSFRNICNKIPRDSMLMFYNNAKTVDFNIPSLSYDNSRINRGKLFFYAPETIFRNCDILCA